MTEEKPRVVSLEIPGTEYSTVVLLVFLCYTREDGREDELVVEVPYYVRNVLLRLAPLGKNTMRTVLREIFSAEEEDDIIYDDFPTMEISRVHLQLWDNEAEDEVAASDLVDIWNFADDETVVDWHGFNPILPGYFSYGSSPTEGYDTETTRDESTLPEPAPLPARIVPPPGTVLPNDTGVTVSYAGGSAPAYTCTPERVPVDTQ
jgi:hypothetical protein